MSRPASAPRRGPAPPVRPRRLVTRLVTRLAHPARALAALALAGCAGRDPTMPSLVERTVSGVRALLGAEAPVPVAAFFLPPLGPARSYLGTFDATRSPVVEVCRVAGPESAACDGAPLARYAVGAPANAALVVDAAQQAYRAEWPAAVGGGTTVRVRVLLDGAELARAHARRPGPGESAPQLQAAGLVALGNGARLPLRVRLETPPPGGQYALPGAPSAPASAASPGHGYTPRAADYAVPDPALPGIGVSHTTVLVALTGAATVGEVNALLARVGAVVVGGTRPGGGGAGSVLALRLPAATPAARDAALATLRAATAVVAAAAPDVLLDASGAAAAAEPAAERPWSTRLPRFVPLRQLDAAVRKELARAPRPLPETVVLESGFWSDPDVPAVRTEGASEGAWHGTGVASVIGATPGNGIGIDGLGTFTVLRPVALGDAAATPNRVADARASLGRMLLAGLDSVLTDPAFGAVRVVNVSLGYGWAKANLDPRTSPAATALVEAQGSVAAAVLRGAAARRGGTLPVIVSAAGNDSRWAAPLPAAMGSPLNAAAAAVRAVVVVEALRPAADGDGERWPQSNVGGHLSAPGHDVPIVVPSGGDAPLPGAGYGRGTSFAAPHVSAAVAYLYALDPALPLASVADNPALDALRAAAVALPGAAPRLDAFGAALALDRRAGAPAKRVQRMLVDIDDGTMDGNARLALDGTTPYLGEDADGDGGAGNGRVDMGDFRRWRDWILEVERTSGLALDGGPTHPKRDVNLNGRTAGQGDDEGVEPRGDFDGDGRITRDDLKVLAGVWQDPGVPADSLLYRVASGDVLVDARACYALPGVDTVTAVLDSPDGVRLVGAAGFRRANAYAALTGPLTVVGAGYAEPYRVLVQARDARGHVISTTGSVQVVRLGGDLTYRARCLMVRPSADTLRLAPGASAPVSAEVLGETDDRRVTFDAAPNMGRVVATGPNAATYTAPDAPGRYLFHARSVADEHAARRVTVVVEQPRAGRVVAVQQADEAKVISSEGTWVGGGGGIRNVTEGLLVSPPRGTFVPYDHSFSRSNSAVTFREVTDTAAFVFVSSAAATSRWQARALGPAHALTGLDATGGATAGATGSGSAGAILNRGYSGAGQIMSFYEVEVVDGPVPFTFGYSCGSGGGPRPGEVDGVDGQGFAEIELQGDTGGGARTTMARCNARRGTSDGGSVSGVLVPGHYFVAVAVEAGAGVQIGAPGSGDATASVGYSLTFGGAPAVAGARAGARPRPASAAARR